MSLQKDVEILTRHGFKAASAIHTSEQLVIVDLLNKIFNYEYPTQILKYTSLLFFNVYANEWLPRLPLLESVKLFSFPLPFAEEAPILELLDSQEYNVGLVGNSFDNVPMHKADKIQEIACRSGLLCVLHITDILNQLVRVEFPDDELVDTGFQCQGVMQNVESVAISTAAPHSVFICRKLTASLVYVPFLVHQ